MKQILVIKPSSLGDIIHGLMVMEALRKERPQLQIDWVVRDIFAPLVQACETVRHCYVFHRKGGIGAFGQLVTQIRETDYDAVVDLQGLARSGLLGLLSGVPRRARYGRSDARELSGLTYGKKAKLPLPSAVVQAVIRAADTTAGEAEVPPPHAVDILRQFLPLFGVAADVPLGQLCFKRESCSEKVAGIIASGRPLILLFPESRRPEKEWGSFAELTQLLLADGVWGAQAANLPPQGMASADAMASQPLQSEPPSPSAVASQQFPQYVAPEDQTADPARQNAVPPQGMTSGGAQAVSVPPQGGKTDETSGLRPLVCWLGSSAVADGGRYDSDAFINLTGITSIAELPLLMAAAAVVVANDSGPMHLAAAMGKKVVALFGPTDPRRYGPYPLSNPNHCVLRAQSGLLTDIAASDVAVAVRDLLSA